MDGRRPSSDAGPRTLLIPCESARSLAAAGPAGVMSFWLEEAIAARSASCTVLPSFEEIPSYSPHSWPYHAPRILGDAKFDQAWVWLGRTPFDEVFLEWLAAAAPVRIGVLAQPLDYPAEAYRRSPHLLAHRSGIEQQLRHLTHVLACDEVDAKSIGDRLGLPAMWLPPAVGARIISLAAPATSLSRTPMLVDDVSDTASGATAGRDTAGATAAASDAAAAALSRLNAGGLARLDLAACAASLGDQFAALQRDHITALAAAPSVATPSAATSPVARLESLQRYVASRRSIRAAFAECRSRALGQAGIAVTLAPDTNAYPIVALECMAAGVPVVCRDIAYRPRNRALFVPGRHLRLFGISDRASLAGHLRDLQHDPSVAQAPVEAALAVVQREHTAERRVDQVFEWLSTGRVPDVTCDAPPNQPQGNPDPDASRSFLPASYRRRAASHAEDARANASGHASDPTRASSGGAEGEGRTEVHHLAVALARACACTRLVDIRCIDPLSLVRASRDIDTVGICAPDVVQTYQRRCADVAWRDMSAGEESLLASVPFDDATIVLCAMQFERSAAPDILAASLSRFVARARCGVVVAVDRDRTWGPCEAGPPPTPTHLQEWTPDELVALLRAAGLTVLHQMAMPAGLGRRELAHTALVVVHETAPPQVREDVRMAAQTACEAYARKRASLSEYELVEAATNIPPAFVMAPVPGAPETPALQAVLGDDRWLALHSGRAPIDEARRWADSLRCEGDGPIVLYGLGLGYHALALAHASASRRLIVVEPFADVVARARELPATREALDTGRIELIDGWDAFKTLMQERPLPLASVCLASIPIYERIAADAFPLFSTFLHGAIAWAKADLDRACKPFMHAKGMSVVITTFNRVAQAAALVEGIARQQPCGVPVEVLLVNDHGTPAVFEAARARLRGLGCALRTFDTHYTGYGPALARNVGLRFARYDTTVFLDDDVEVGSDLLRCYREAPVGIRMGRIDFLYGGDRPQPRRVPDRRVALRGPARLLRPAADFEGFMWSANCAVPTEVALTLGGFDEAFLNEGEEDLDFSARAIRATHRPVAVPSAIALHQELDLVGETTSNPGRKARISRANERLADPARGLVVNGGVTYWAGDRWQRYIVSDRAAT